MRVICEEARRAGILTGAHCTALDGAKNAIKAGVRSVEHVQMNEEIARMMRTNGTYYCPTIVTRYNILHLLDPSLQWLKQKARPTDLDGKKRAIQLCHKYGIPVCASTDSMNSSKAEHAVTKLGVSLATELHIYVEFGMTNEEALLTATKTASEMLCIGNQVGTLEVDKCADLVLLDGNPLDCIDNVSRVVKTYQRGKLSFSA
jgi:imidazolonepropionase-like amidohydrolase